MMEELKARFEALTEKEKTQFMRAIMPEMCELFKANSKDMMPYCKDMMKDCNIDMPQMMTMMSMMK